MVNQTQIFHDCRLNHWVVNMSCQVLKPIVFIGTFGHGGTFTKETLEEIASYQDVCTPSSSPLPPNLNRTKTMPNLFWFYIHVPTITLPKFTNKSDNANFSFPWRRKWSSCHKQIDVMTQVAKSSIFFLEPKISEINWIMLGIWGWQQGSKVKTLNLELVNV
jgi:hypothetical protein